METTTKRELKRATPEEQRNRAIMREHIGHQLRNHYQAFFTTEELPPRLLVLIEKLKNDTEILTEEIKVTGKAENETES
jgi:hypothetical protein